MKSLTVVQGALQESNADTLVVNLFQGVTFPGGATGALDTALSGAIAELIEQGDLKGKLGEVVAVYPRGAINAKRVLVVGLGDRATFDLEAVRKASAAALRTASKLGAKHVATIVHGGGIGGLNASKAAQATAEGALLALYQFDAYKKEELSEIETITLTELSGDKLADVETGANAAKAIAEGVYLARDLVNMPPNIATPSKLAQTATELAEVYALGLTVGDRFWAQERDMGAFLAVAKGAGEEPKFIVLEHNADKEELETIVLVGKGVTFDTGGISLKASSGMPSMKSDMGGAAAVLGAMKAVAELDLPLRVIAITPATENMPDANAYRPSDVIKASNGKTIEIISTDAEGRMILADALVYAGQYKPNWVIDLATLTGSCVIALGKGVAAGLFSTDDSLRDELVEAGNTTFERVWPLPLYKDYRKTIDSDVANMKNTGGRTGGVGTSAVFLQEFTDYPWAHLDIAGMALSDSAKGYTGKGGTGFGVRLLVELLRSRV